MVYLVLPVYLPRSHYLRPSKRITMAKKSGWFRLGLVLIIISVFLFLALPVIPFLSLEGKLKISLSTLVFILAELLFWTGGILLGKELFAKYRAYLNPLNWFSTKNEKDEL
jgi:hypothetical protein